jgi:hypothetical protein
MFPRPGEGLCRRADRGSECDVSVAHHERRRLVDASQYRIVPTHPRSGSFDFSTGTPDENERRPHRVVAVATRIASGSD